MTIEFRHPNPGEEAALRELFTEAFEDAAFTDLFFRGGSARSGALPPMTADCSPRSTGSTAP